MKNTDNNNFGSHNSSKQNNGQSNTGNLNFGDINNRNNNLGNASSGYDNAGNNNLGKCNIGNSNFGNFNVSNYCFGDFNNVNFGHGCFNTEQQYIYMSNKPTKITMEEWYASEAYKLLSSISFRPTKWVHSSGMTYKEKEEYPHYTVTDEYLKRRNVKPEYIEWWNVLYDIEKYIIMNMPNFDKDIFKQITGIDVDRDSDEEIVWF